MVLIKNMEFIKRSEIEKRLSRKVMLKRAGWLTSQFDNVFESNHVTGRISEDRILNMIGKFLKNQDMHDIVFFPDSTGWRLYWGEQEMAPVTFSTAEEAISFLRRATLYCVDNYYIANMGIEWILTICHEGDFHISGSMEFVERFKKECLYSVS